MRDAIGGRAAQLRDSKLSVHAR